MLIIFFFWPASPQAYTMLPNNLSYQPRFTSATSFGKVSIDQFSHHQISLGNISLGWISLGPSDCDESHLNGSHLQVFEKLTSLQAPVQPSPSTPPSFAEN